MTFAVQAPKWRRLGASAARSINFPLVYWPFDDSIVQGSTTMLDVDERGADYGRLGSAYTALPWYEGTTTGTGWSAREGWFTFPGGADTSGDHTFFRLALSAAGDYQDALELGDNCLLICGRISPDNVTGTKAIFTLGRAVDSNAYYRIYLNGAALTLRLCNGDGTNATYAGTDITAADYTFAVVLDNRPDFRMIWMHVTDSAGRPQFINPKVNVKGTIAWDTGNVNQAIQIGGLLRFGGGDINYFDGAMQRIFVVNYGDTPPNNLSGICETAMRNGALPGEYLNG